ncbi:MAG: 4a-hydroxytetrahydrobiopterin dehydratase [Planctomycetota bacterium]
MNAPERLSDQAVQANLAALPGWTLADGSLRWERRFADFAEAFAFMTRVALLAERRDHHPDWSNCWNRVTIRLSTHDAGGITERDLELARAIDALLRD